MRFRCGLPVSAMPFGQPGESPTTDLLTWGGPFQFPPDITVMLLLSQGLRRPVFLQPVLLARFPAARRGRPMVTRSPPLRAAGTGSCLGNKFALISTGFFKAGNAKESAGSVA